MKNDAAQLTKAVQRRFAGTPDPRLRRIMAKLIEHLHAFVAETKLTPAEWFAAIDVLTRTGQMCTDTRQEFILLSDTLGVSMLVDLLNHARPGATETTVLGPFYVPQSPARAAGETIAPSDEGAPAVLTGRVLDVRGRPIAGATLDVWQTASNGMYDVQDEQQPLFNMRGLFTTDAEGRYHIHTVRPRAYQIPSDGPVGQMLKATKRHPWRPAHIHFIVGANGYQPVTTHLFDKADKYLASDAVFGVKDSLIRTFTRVSSRAEAARYGVRAPFWHLDFDFRLARAKAARRR